MPAKYCFTAVVQSDVIRTFHAALLLVGSVLRRRWEAGWASSQIRSDFVSLKVQAVYLDVNYCSYCISRFLPWYFCRFDDLIPKKKVLIFVL